MCKLCAFVNLEPVAIPYATGILINKALKHLFYINSYGQEDGSGIMWMDDKGNSKYIKEAVASPTLINFKAFDNIKNDFYKFKFVAAHTRFSTVGTNSWENSHPFHHGNYLGMQNGTIKSNHKALVPGEISPCEVDSSSVIWAINKQGIDKTFEEYQGEGVFMFFDLKTKSFNIVKNDRRTLFRAKLSSHNAYLISTDTSALQLVIDRSGLTTDPIEPVPNDQLITYGLDNTLSTRPLTVNIPTYVYPDATSYYGRTYGHYYTPSKYTQPTKSPARLPSVSTSKASGEYLCDCALCGNPITSRDKFYTDNQNIDLASIVSCESCLAYVETYANANLYLYTGVLT